MATPAQIQQVLESVTDETSLVQHLLGDTLCWPVGDRVEKIEDIAYGWSAEDLRAQDLQKELIDGRAWQVQPVRDDQPWGVFVLQFANARGFRTHLRQVLRGLVPNRRSNPSARTWKHENLLFICTTAGCDRFTFAHFRGDKAQAARLTTFSWERDQPYRRTVCEHNLPALAWPNDNGKDGAAWLKSWSKAFDVEAVTRRFFRDYAEVFAAVESAVKGVRKDDDRRLFTQRLFNRLMFLYFIQRKGWLTFDGNKNYLRALFNAATAAGEDFLNDRLYWTFFYGLNTPGESMKVHSEATLKERRGEVPFLNGGLFDLEDDYDVQGRVKVPNEAFGRILDLFERYNFTVTESTPLDIEVAVDPEMLGKVFEELVTGRHETGSYYTPRPVVAFMCRESLKHYLAPVIDDAAVRAAFVDDSDSTHLRDPEAVLNVLRNVKVCDPACGSGAYLLGMMHELLRLRQALFASSGVDSVTVYQRKLDIIQNNLYGVDIDVFAVNIAKLRLWLSLVVDFEGAKPPPLPNLDFKIECGDSLSAPDPQQIDDLFRSVLVKQADKLAELKAKYLQTYGSPKKKLAARIKAEEAKLREQLSEQCPDNSVDWRVAFAEVFAVGGFDVVIANPPYIRQESLKEYKPYLKQRFPKIYSGTADLYVYFYGLGYELLRPGGELAFISSNSFARAGFAEPFRRFLTSYCRLEQLIDLGDTQIFSTAKDVYPAIVLFSKRATKQTSEVERVRSLRFRRQERGENMLELMSATPIEVAVTNLNPEGWRFEPDDVIALRNKLTRGGRPLGEYVQGRIYRGLITGLNEAFIIDAADAKQLVRKGVGYKDILKPFVGGQDLRRWYQDESDNWAIVMPHGISASRCGSNDEATAWRWLNKTYPAIAQHLGRFEIPARKRGDKGQFWWELRPCDYYGAFDNPKIMYPDIAKSSRFSIDIVGLYSANTT